MDTVIMAIDPGYSTGAVIIGLDGNMVGGREIETEEEVLDWIIGSRPNLVIIEDFVGAGPRTKEAITVLKFIGKIIGLCYVIRIPVVMQAPQVRIPLHHDAEELLPKGTSVHIVDAFAHALAWLEREG